MGFRYHKRLQHYVLQLFVLILCSFSFSSAINTIKANQSLSNSEDLISSGNRFKLSFFSPANSSRRYLGIIYNLPVMTVVWVANRDKPLNDSLSTFQISSDGNLVILDGRKEIVWSTNLPPSAANRSAVLLYTGNLILRDDSSNAHVWESFLHASDSWLEKMKIFTDLSKKEKNILTSWTSPDDPAPGSFTFAVEPSGIPQAFVWKDGNPYWRSGMISSDDFQRNAYMSFTVSESSVLQYSVLNSSGNLEMKVWSDEKKEWEEKEAVINNECDIYGKCGPFGICDAKDMPICTCIPGFIPKSDLEWEEGNWTSGCTRKTHLQCGQDRFLELESVMFPDHYKWYPAYKDCKGACLSDCSCIAYANFSGIGCLHWTLRLIDVQRLPYSHERLDSLYIRGGDSSALGNKQEDRARAITLTIVVLGFMLIAICGCFLPKLLFRYRGSIHIHPTSFARKYIDKVSFFKTKATNVGSSKEIMLRHDKRTVQLEELRIFQFQMLSNATGNFDPINKLGQGGFGLVYKGKFPSGEEIAVKRLARSSNQGVEEFMNEVEVISRLQHRNLVRLIGCCVESEEKMLVYEYMPNGSLDAYLFNSHKGQFVDWKTCKLIIEGIYRGLLYLHRDSRLKIIHRDLKASNILLDEELSPKISDFGMARIFSGKNHQDNTLRVVGTYGYMSPEYALHGIFSEKSDVYSFGVLLLEIVSGRKNSKFYDEDQQLFLIPYAWKLWNEGNIINLMDPAIYGSGMEDDIVRYANVGLLCVQEIAANRPNISTILSMLSSEIVELPHPKQPAFLGMQTTSSAKSSSKCFVNDVTISIFEGR